MERRRVVITGLGAITPVGLTAEESWQAVKDGACGIAPITQFDPSASPMLAKAQSTATRTGPKGFFSLSLSPPPPDHWGRCPPGNG